VLKLFSQVEIGTENNSTLPLELAIVDSVIKTEEETARPTVQIETQPKPAPRTVPLKTVPVQSQPQNIQPETKKVESKPEPAPPVVEDKHSPLEAGSIIEKLRLEWRNVVEQAPADTKRSHALAILRSAGVKPVLFENDTLTLSFRHSLYKEKLEEIENHRVVEKIISNYLGHTCKVQCVLENNNNLMKEALKLGAQIEVEET
jgi:DNA polymerase-3 subunit gamma/tau